jgi:hypothetical protein
MWNIKLSVLHTVWTGIKVKPALSELFDTDAYRHIVSLPLTGLTPSSPEALHTKQA